MTDERVARAALARALGAMDTEPIVIEREGVRLSLSVLRTATRARGGASNAELRLAVLLDGVARSAPSAHVDERPVVRLAPRTSDPWGKRLGLDRAVSTGDEGFDERVTIESGAGAAALAASFAREETRGRVLALFALRCSELGLFRGGEPDESPLTADVWIRPADADEVRRLESIAVAIIELARSLPSFSGQRSGRRSRWRDIATVPFAATPLVGLLLSLSAFDAYRPVDVLPHVLAVLPGLGALIVVLPLAFLALRRRPAASRDFVLVALASVIGLPALSLGAALWMNGAMDPRPPEDHVAQIAGVRWPRGTHAQLDVSDWREPGATLVARVEGRLGRSVREGDEVVLRIGRGRFGWPWIARVSRR